MRTAFSAFLVLHSEGPKCCIHSGQGATEPVALAWVPDNVRVVNVSERTAVTLPGRQTTLAACRPRAVHQKR
jgi:hypothetical protein